MIIARRTSAPSGRGRAGGVDAFSRGVARSLAGISPDIFRAPPALARLDPRAVGLALAQARDLAAGRYSGMGGVTLKAKSTVGIAARAPVCGTDLAGQACRTVDVAFMEIYGRHPNAKELAYWTSLDATPALVDANGTVTRPPIRPIDARPSLCLAVMRAALAGTQEASTAEGTFVVDYGGSGPLYALTNQDSTGLWVTPRHLPAIQAIGSVVARNAAHKKSAGWPIAAVGEDAIRVALRAAGVRVISMASIPPYVAWTPRRLECWDGFHADGPGFDNRGDYVEERHPSRRSHDNKRDIPILVSDFTLNFNCLHSRDIGAWVAQVRGPHPQRVWWIEDLPEPLRSLVRGGYDLYACTLKETPEDVASCIGSQIVSDLLSFISSPYFRLAVAIATDDAFSAVMAALRIVVDQVEEDIDRNPGRYGLDSTNGAAVAAFIRAALNSGALIDVIMRDGARAFASAGTYYTLAGIFLAAADSPNASMRDGLAEWGRAIAYNAELIASAVRGDGRVGYWVDLKYTKPIAAGMRAAVTGPDALASTAKALGGLGQGIRNLAGALSFLPNALVGRIAAIGDALLAAAGAMSAQVEAAKAAHEATPDGDAPRLRAQLVAEQRRAGALQAQLDAALVAAAAAEARAQRRIAEAEARANAIAARVASSGEDKGGAPPVAAAPSSGGGGWLVGAGAGFLVAGPPGALIGAIVGATQ